MSNNTENTTNQNQEPFYSLNMNKSEYEYIKEVICGAYNSLKEKEKLINSLIDIATLISTTSEQKERLKELIDDFEKKKVITESLHSVIHDLKPINPFVVQSMELLNSEINVNITNDGNDTTGNIKSKSEVPTYLAGATPIRFVNNDNINTAFLYQILIFASENPVLRDSFKDNLSYFDDSMKFLKDYFKPSGLDLYF